MTTFLLEDLRKPRPPTGCFRKADRHLSEYQVGSLIEQQKFKARTAPCPDEEGRNPASSSYLTEVQSKHPAGEHADNTKLFTCT